MVPKEQAQKVGRYFVATQPHSSRCYEPHCAESRHAVIDRLSGNRVTALHELPDAETMAQRLSEEWNAFKQQEGIEDIRI